MSTNTFKKEYIKKSYKLYKPKNMKINSLEKNKSVKTIKKHLPSRHSLTNKFFRSLRSTCSQWSRPKKHIFPNIIDKNTFNFNLSDENNDLLKRDYILKIGEKKHNYFSKISNKKKIEKINSAKEFLNKMKIMQNNLEIIKKKNLEEKRKMKELILTRKIKKFKKYDLNNKVSRRRSIFNEEKLKTFDKKLTIEKDKLMNRFNEIMRKKQYIE